LNTATSVNATSMTPMIEKMTSFRRLLGLAMMSDRETR